MRFLFASLLVVALSVASLAPAGEPFLLKDINPAGDSNPLWLTSVNGILFFQADDGINGPELWKSNGTEAGTVMVTDIYPGSTGSEPEEIININGTLFFRARDANGYGLWKSNGTQAGTVIVKSVTTYPQYLTDVNGTLFFGCSYYPYGLWKSDGTEEGTVMINTLPYIYPKNLTDVNGTLFFTDSPELWKSDGTEEGTVMVSNIWESFGPMNLANVNGTLFFAADDDTNGFELWKSDGTEEGTVMVKNIHEDTYSGWGTFPSSSNPAHLTDFKGTLFFSADNGTNGNELWKSNGTEVGTVMVKDINPDSSSSNPSDLININGTLFFTARDGTNGYELWKSDGTETGTVMVKDINPGAGSSNPSDMTNFNGTLFFTANNGTNGYELWKSDGTAAGTVMISDIYPGGGSSWPVFLTDVDNALFFSTDDYELWMYVQNDDCQDAFQVYLNQTFYSSSNGAAGTDLTSCAYNDSADVWFYYVPEASGKYTISVSSSEFDTTLAVFNTCGGNELACSDDFTDTDSQISLDMAKGKRYYIRVAGFDGHTGSFQLSVTTKYCTEYPVSDLNRDCTVDMQDFAIMASNWVASLSP